MRLGGRQRPAAGTTISNAEISELGIDDKVLIRHHHRLRGRASGAEVNFDYWAVITLRDGKVVRHEWFTENPAARSE